MVAEKCGSRAMSARSRAPKAGMAMEASIGCTGAASMKNPAPSLRSAKWCDATLWGAP